jgi:hypothetical protein
MGSGTDSIEVWVLHRAILEAAEKANIELLLGVKPRFLGYPAITRVTVLTELSQY